MPNNITIDYLLTEINTLKESLANLNRYTDELHNEHNDLVIYSRRKAAEFRTFKERIVKEINQNSEAFVDLEERLDTCERDSENALERAEENQTDIGGLEDRLDDIDIQELTEFISGQFNRLGRWMQSVDARLGGE